MRTWNEIFAIIENYATLEDNIVNLDGYSDGTIIDDYENNVYEFYSHNYTVRISKDTSKDWLLRIFDAYFEDCDTFDEVVTAFSAIQKHSEQSDIDQQVFEFQSTVSLIEIEKTKESQRLQTVMFNVPEKIIYKISRLTFKEETDKIEYAFCNIEKDIADDMNTISIYWTVYAKSNATEDDAKKYIIEHLLTSDLVDLKIDNCYLNFGLTFIRQK